VALPQTNGEFHVLCHEHHLRMKPALIPLTVNGSRTQEPAYVCPETDCIVRYSSSYGYFMRSQNGSGIETDPLMPRVKCDMDGMPMYLAEVLRERKSFRMWKCPKCGLNHTVNSYVRRRE
jgi:uncharacterized C2H2 Zn-finger protein